MMIQRLRFEHPAVAAVVITSGKRVLCRGKHSHAWAVEPWAEGKFLQVHQ
jgi:hypothetical protein